jgi:hypothetical protein
MQPPAGSQMWSSVLPRLLNEAAVADLRVGEPLRVIINRAAGHTGGFEHLDPVLGGPGRQHRIHHVL